MPIGIKFKTEAERKKGKRLARARYYKSEKGKQTQARYQKSEEGKQVRARYYKSEKGKQARARSNKLDYLRIKDTEEYKKRRKAAQKAWWGKKGALWNRTYKKRRRGEPSYKIVDSLRKRIVKVLKNQKAKKYYHFNEVIG